MEPQQTSKKKVLMIALLVLVLAIAGAYYWVFSQKDVSSDVQAELDSINLDGLESELQSLDADLNQL